MFYKIIILLIFVNLQLIQSSNRISWGVRLTRTCPAKSVCIPYANCTAVVYNLGGVYSKDLIANKKNCEINSHICCSEAEINYLLPSNCGETEKNKIGINAAEAEPFQFPWMAIIGTLTDYAFLDEPIFNLVCGGFLINNRYVLTSAHCIVDELLDYKVRLGEHNLNSSPDCLDSIGKFCTPEYDVDVEKVIRHPFYNNKTHDNDIALIRLNTDISFNRYIRPICLPINFEVNDENLGIMEIAGWGLTEEGYTAEVLRTTIMNYTNFADCKYYYGTLYGIVREYKFCAHGENNKDACKGDSGGPLMASIDGKMVAVGIITGGNIHCGANISQPGLYERVSSHMDWIFRSLQP